MKWYLLILAVLLLTFSSCTTRVVTTAPSNKVVVIKNIPKHHKVVMVNGMRYYRWNGNYYRKTKKGYVIVRI